MFYNGKKNSTSLYKHKTRNKYIKCKDNNLE